MKSLFLVLVVFTLGCSSTPKNKVEPKEVKKTGNMYEKFIKNSVNLLGEYHLTSSNIEKRTKRKKGKVDLKINFSSYRPDEYYNPERYCKDLNLLFPPDLNFDGARCVYDEGFFFDSMYPVGLDRELESILYPDKDSFYYAHPFSGLLPVHLVFTVKYKFSKGKIRERSYFFYPRIKYNSIDFEGITKLASTKAILSNVIPDKRELPIVGEIIINHSYKMVYIYGLSKKETRNLMKVTINFDHKKTLDYYSEIIKEYEKNKSKCSHFKNDSKCFLFAVKDVYRKYQKRYSHPLHFSKYVESKNKEYNSFLTN